MSITQERYDETRLAIFESNLSGVIDDDKKEKLLDSLNNVTESYNDESITESEADELFDAIMDKANGVEPVTESFSDEGCTDTVYITESEYNNMRLKIFNDWETGQISESVRNELFDRMNEKYEVI